MVFGGNVFYPAASLTKTVPVISISGLAKHYVVPGWRVGWIMVHDRNEVLKDVRTAYFKLSQMILGANSIVQVGSKLTIGSLCDYTHSICRSLERDPRSADASSWQR